MYSLQERVQPTYFQTLRTKNWLEIHLNSVRGKGKCHVRKDRRKMIRKMRVET